MDLLHGTRERHHHHPHVGDSADDRHPRGEPRALEVARHLIAHDLGLLAYLEGEWLAAVGGGFVEHDRDRRLEGMGEIAHVGACARDDLPIGLDQGVGLACQGRDLHWEGAFELLRIACANGGKSF